MNKVEADSLRAKLRRYDQLNESKQELESYLESIKNKGQIESIKFVTDNTLIELPTWSDALREEITNSVKGVVQSWINTITERMESL